MISKAPEPEPPEPEGGMGGLFTDTQQVAGGVRHLRSDARLAARILSLGVVEEGQIAMLLRAGVGLAASCAKAGNARGYSAIMSVFIAAAKVELQTVEHVQPAPVLHQHEHSHVLVPPEQRAIAIEARLLAEAKARGLIIDGTVNGNGGGGGANGHSSKN